MEIVLLALLLPIAFVHGVFVGQRFGVKQGASIMYDMLYAKGTPTDTVNVRTISLRKENDSD